LNGQNIKVAKNTDKKNGLHQQTILKILTNNYYCPTINTALQNMSFPFSQKLHHPLAA